MTDKSLLATIIMLYSMGCSPTSKIPEISVMDLADLDKNGANITVIDVRTRQEYIEERLKFVDDHIPYDQLDKHLDQLPQDKSSEIYFFCRSGRRSAIATEYLISIGYTNVYNITGGIIAWKTASYPINVGK